MTPFLLFILAGSLVCILFGVGYICMTWKKSRIVKCSFCNEKMDKDDFKQHAEHHIQSSDTRTKIVSLKAWLLKELEKEQPMTEEQMIKEGAIVCGLSVHTVKRILSTMVEYNGGHEEKV